MVLFTISSGICQVTCSCEATVATFDLASNAVNRWKRGITLLIEDAIAALQVEHMGAVGIFIHKLLMQFYCLDHE